MKEVQMEARCSKCGRTFMVLMDDAQGGFGELHYVCPECTEKAERQTEQVES